MKILRNIAVGVWQLAGVGVVIRFAWYAIQQAMFMAGHAEPPRPSNIWLLLIFVGSTFNALEYLWSNPTPWSIFSDIKALFKDPPA